MIKKIKETADFLRLQIKSKPEIAVILGSGLGNFANKIDISQTIDYKDIPNFPISTVEGHKGKLVIGKIKDKDVIAMQGRFHYYEGYSMQEITIHSRVFKLLGINYMLVSNAAGGINLNFKVGDLMIIKDHINNFPEHPLRGKNLDEFGVRFPDMTQTYNPELIKLARKIGQENNLQLQEGVYIGSSGPTFETQAEYKYFKIIGADSTGMSTVPEVIVAHHSGIKCFGVSVITNIGIKTDLNKIDTHEEVQDVGKIAEPKLTTLFEKMIEKL